MIIGISGKKQSGKDTVGRILQLLSQGFNREEIEQILKHKDISNTSMWEIKKFAGKVKEVLSLLTGIQIEELEKESIKESFLPDAWRDEEGNEIITNRMGLQWIGTDLFREQFHPNTWVNALMKDYIGKNYGRKGTFFNEVNAHYETLYPKWIITDVRFENEIKAIRNKEGVILRIERYEKKENTDISTTGDDSPHISEVSLDNYKKFDYFIINNSSIRELIRKVERFATKLKEDDRYN